MPGTFVVGGLVVLSLALGGTARAQSSCDAGVTTAAAKKVSGKLRVFAVAQRRGAPPNQARLTGCEEKFAATCASAQDSNDCQSQGSSCDTLETTADAAVDDLRGTTPAAPTPSRCDAGVTKAVAKKVRCKLQVFAMAQRTGAPANGTRLTRCEDKFAAACSRARSRGDCQAQTATCAALETRADAAIDELRRASTSTTTTTTTSTTLDPLRPCGEDPDGTCGGACERGDCVRHSLSGTCVCSRPCGRDPDGTCGGICDFYPAEYCDEDQAGNCVCIFPCQALGGIGSCRGTCADPRAVCSFNPPPLPSCACIIPCAPSECSPPCGPSQGCILNPDTAACVCVP